MSEQPQNARQITVNDIIHSDERVVNLKKQYQEFANKKNELILEISRVEADIIKTMGAFEYLNNFTDTEEARKELIAKFLPLITGKHGCINKIAEQDANMEICTATFQKLADSIVEDLKKAAADMQSQLQSAPESAPESAPDGCGHCAEGCECRKDVTFKAETLQIGSSSQGQEGHEQQPTIISAEQNGETK